MAPLKVGDVGIHDGAFTNPHVLTLNSTQAGFCTAGNMLILRMGAAFAGLTDPVVTDSRSNTYTKILNYSDSGIGMSVAVYASLLTTSLQNGDTITVTLSSGAPFMVHAAAFSGVTAVLDSTAKSNPGTFAGTWATAADTTTNAADLLLVVGGGSNTGYTDTPASGWTDEEVVPSTVQAMTFISQYRIVAATGTYTGGGTLSAGAGVSNIIVALKGASSGGGGAVSVVNANVDTGLAGGVSSPFTYALPNNPTAGNTLVVGVQAWSQTGGVVPGTPTVTDSLGNTFTHATPDGANVAAPPPSTGFAPQTTFHYCQGCLGGADTLSVQYPNANAFTTITVWELSAGAAFDQCVAASGLTSSGNQNINAGSITPSISGAFGAFLGVETVVGTDDWTSTGWTVLDRGTGGPNAGMSAYQTGLSGPTTFGMPFTANGGYWAASGITFVPPVAPSDPTVLRTLSSPRLV